MTPKISVIKKLNGGNTEATVELVEIEGKHYVLKSTSLQEAKAERLFNDLLNSAGQPTLRQYNHVSLNDNQLLLEYIVDSKTLSKERTIENFKNWGRVVRAMHEVNYTEFFVLDSDGDKVVGSWEKFITAQIDLAIQKYISYTLNIADVYIDDIRKSLSYLKNYIPQSYSLVHGDLHMQNALLRGKEVVLYDKDVAALVAPPLYDLATIYAEGFPSGLYAKIDERHKNDPEFLAAFLSGYGQIDDSDLEWLDHFVLLRSLARCPNPFVPRLDEVISSAFHKLMQPPLTTA